MKVRRVLQKQAENLLYTCYLESLTGIFNPLIMECRLSKSPAPSSWLWELDGIWKYELEQHMPRTQITLGSMMEHFDLNCHVQSVTYF